MTYNMTNTHSRRALSRAFRAALLTAASLGSLLCAEVRATLLPTPGAVALSAEDPLGAYNVIDSTGPIPFTAFTPAPAVAYSGTLTSLVVSNDANNPYGLNALTFLYQLNITAGPNSVERLTVNSYAGFPTYASYRSNYPVLNVPPNIAPSFATRDASGDVVGFSFLTTQLSPGSTSAWMVVATDATNYHATTASVIDGSVASGILTFAPAVQVPEPCTLALGGLGALSLGLALRRRRR